jgi:hypothetical protein
VTFKAVPATAFRIFDANGCCVTHIETYVYAQTRPPASLGHPFLDIPSTVGGRARPSALSLESLSDAGQVWLIRGRKVHGAVCVLDHESNHELSLD